MKIIKKLSLLLFTCSIYANVSAQSYLITKDNIQLNFSLDAAGKPTYAVNYKGKAVIKPSALGMVIKEVGSLDNGFIILSKEETVFNQNWEPVWGEVKIINNDYKELKLSLQAKADDGKPIIIDLIFRVFADGVGFRYHFPIQANLNHFIVSDEKTNFNYCNYWFIQPCKWTESKLERSPCSCYYCLQ